MPYRVWHYTCKLVFIPLMALTGLALLLGGTAKLILGGLALLLLIVVAAIGGIMGVRMARGTLRMRCPFCRTHGPAWGSKAEGMRMECPQCGVIRSGGRLGLGILRERNSRTPDPSD